MISDEDVSAILRGNDSLEAAADELIKAANQSGGKDNITVVMFRLGEDGAGEEDEEDEPPPDETLAGQTSATQVREAAPPTKESKPAVDRQENQPARAPGRRPAAYRGARAAAPPSRTAGARSAGRTAARGGGHRRAVRAQPPVVLRRHQRRGPGHALPRRALRAAAGDRPLQRGVRQRRARQRDSERTTRPGARPRARRSEADASDLVRQLERGQLDPGPS